MNVIFKLISTTSSQNKSFWFVLCNTDKGIVRFQDVTAIVILMSGPRKVRVLFCDFFLTNTISHHCAIFEGTVQQKIVPG